MAEPIVAPVLAYSPDAILTPTQVAEWLGVSLKTLATLPIKRTKLGRRTVRYRGQWVIEYLERRAT